MNSSLASIPPLSNLMLTPNAETLAAPAVPALSVSHMAYDSESGWSVEVARAGQWTDGTPAPNPKDLPEDVREYLIDWLTQGRS